MEFGIWIYFVMPQPPVKLFVRPAFYCVRRIIFREQLKERSSRFLDFGRMRLDFHPVSHRRATGRHERLKSLHLDETKTARGCWFVTSDSYARVSFE